MNNTVNYDYAGARILVTGGTSGIGYAIARAFDRAGAHVTVTGTHDSPEAYDDIDLSRFSYCSLEVRDVDAIKALAADLEGLDILVNNAGASLPAGDEWTHEGFEASIQVNLLSAWHMSRACLDHLSASEMNGGASVIGIASLTSFFANEWVPGYGAAKAGAAHLMRHVAREVGPYGVTANVVSLGLMDNVPEEFAGPIVRTIPMRRLGSGDDVAAAVDYLASDAASWVTGQTLPVNGGSYAI